jgi:protein-disulfide isomerase
MIAQLTRPVGISDHVQGPADAPVTLVEYGDYECPHCGRAYPIVKTVQQHMGDRLRFAYRHFPLSQIHPHAENAAEMAEAAGHQGRFWAMHDTLFQNQHALEDEDLVSYAAALGIDARWAAGAIATHAFAAKVRNDFISGVRSGVNGTPTFFINGMRDDTGSWVDATSFLHLLERSAEAATSSW